jgi:hypothetical protein
MSIATKEFRMGQLLPILESRVAETLSMLKDRANGGPARFQMLINLYLAVRFSFNWCQ